MVYSADKNLQFCPAIYPAHLVQLVARWGISQEALLAGTGIDAASLSDPDARVGAAAMAALVERAIRLTREPGLGFYFGLHLKISAHGVVGIAAMTSSTLRDALLVAERFVPLRLPSIEIAYRAEGEQAVVEVVETVQIGPRHGFLIETLFVALAQMGKMLIGRPMHGVFEMAFPEPKYFQGFAHLLPGPVRFQQPSNRILFPASFLDEPLQLSDAFASRQAIEQCERELATLGAASTLLASVRRQMVARKTGFPSLTELADQRGVSVRTLKRQLAEHGTSFQELLDELRRDRALALLAASHLPIERVAEVLGYSDASNFNRAFRRWMGVAPSAWREANAGRQAAAR